MSAFDRGADRLAESFFQQPPEFQWYSEPPDRLEGRRVSPYDYGSLDEYLLGQHVHGERLELVSVNYAESGGRVGNFGFVARRNGEVIQSKGAVDCTTGLFIVFSLGPNPGPTP